MYACSTPSALLAGFNFSSFPFCYSPGSANTFTFPYPLVGGLNSQWAGFHVGLFIVLGTILLAAQVTQIIQKGQKETLGNLFFSQPKPGSNDNYTTNIYNSMVSGVIYIFIPFCFHLLQ